MPHILAGALVGAVAGALLARSQRRTARGASVWVVVLVAAACGALIGSTFHSPPMEETPDIGAGGFDSAVADGVALVEFFATWCPPCRRQAPIVDQVAASVGDRAAIIKLDVDKHADIAQRFNIDSIPTIIIFSNGSEKKRFEGLTSKARLVDAINDVARQ